MKYNNTCRSFFKRPFAKPRHGVTEQLQEFIFVRNISSATRTASSKMWLRGKAVKQSKIALRRNFIISILLEASCALPSRTSKLNPHELVWVLVKTSLTLLNFSERKSGTASRLRIFSVQLELFVHILQEKRKKNPTLSMIDKQTS